MGKQNIYSKTSSKQQIYIFKTNRGAFMLCRSKIMLSDIQTVTDIEK